MRISNPVKVYLELLIWLMAYGDLNYLQMSMIKLVTGLAGFVIKLQERGSEVLELDI